MRPPLPPLQTLRILELAVRERSFTRAGAALGLSHGAVSRRIAALEEWRGEKLFERRGQSMEPTEAALAIVAKARPGLDLLTSAFGHPVQREDTDGLKITTTAAIAQFLLLAGETQPPAGLIGAIETTARLDPLDRGGSEAAIRYGSGPWDNLRSVRLGGERMVVIGQPDLLASETDWRDLPRLETRFFPWQRWFDLSQEAARPAARILKVSDTAQVIAGALGGSGVAIAPRRLVATMLRHGVLGQASSRSVEDGYSYHFIWRPDLEEDPRVADLRDWLLEVFELSGESG